MKKGFLTGLSSGTYDGNNPITVDTIYDLGTGDGSSDGGGGIENETDPTVPSHVKAISTGDISNWNGKENSFSKNGAFNKNFGTSAGTVAEGNDVRLARGQTAYNWGQTKGNSYTGNSLNLSNVAGNNYNYASFASYTSYSVNNAVLNGFARCFINAASEPTVSGATKIGLTKFLANTPMEMVVECPHAGVIEYYFLNR